MVVVNPQTIKEIKKYSKNDFNIDACFNCGNCTAICPLSDEKHSFPRMLIRYGQIGLEERLLGNLDIWNCSYCNECSETCPRNATPGEFVAATRKWAIAHYDFTHLSSFLQTNKFGLLIFSLILAGLSLIVFGLIGDFSVISDQRPIRLFNLFTKEEIEILGILFGLGFGVLVFVTTIRMIYLTLKYENKHLGHNQTNLTLKEFFNNIPLLVSSGLYILWKEVIKQEEQLKCNTEVKTQKPLYKTHWFIHILVMWGFLGLLLATILDMLFKPDSNQFVPFYSPIRLLGIISGLMLIIGTSIILYYRITKPDKYYQKSGIDDIYIPLLLWLIGISGLLITFTFYISAIPASFAYYMFIFHLIVVVVFFVIAPFTKISHIWIRSVALWIDEFLDRLEKNNS